MAPKAVFATRLRPLSIVSHRDTVQRLWGFTLISLPSLCVSILWKAMIDLERSMK